MSTTQPQFPIVLQSPSRNGFTFFRRINADMTVERKQLGQPWEPNDTPKLVIPLDKYLFHLTQRLGWRICENEPVRRPHEARGSTGSNACLGSP